MVRLPRVDEQLQTGIWYPYHKALEKGQWHPVRELYTTHDAFVPDRYALAMKQARAAGRTRATASPNTELGSPSTRTAGMIYAMQDRVNRSVGAGWGDTGLAGWFTNARPGAANRRVTRKVKKASGRHQHIPMPPRFAPAYGARERITRIKASLPALQRPLPANIALPPASRKMQIALNGCCYR